MPTTPTPTLLCNLCVDDGDGQHRRRTTRRSRTRCCAARDAAVERISVPAHARAPLLLRRSILEENGTPCTRRVQSRRRHSRAKHVHAQTQAPSTAPRRPLPEPRYTWTSLDRSRRRSARRSSSLSASQTPPLAVAGRTPCARSQTPLQDCSNSSSTFAVRRHHANSRYRQRLRLQNAGLHQCLRQPLSPPAVLCAGVPMAERRGRIFRESLQAPRLGCPRRNPGQHRRAGQVHRPRHAACRACEQLHRQSVRRLSGAGLGQAHQHTAYIDARLAYVRLQMLGLRLRAQGSGTAGTGSPSARMRHRVRRRRIRQRHVAGTHSQHQRAPSLPPRRVRRARRRLVRRASCTPSAAHHHVDRAVQAQGPDQHAEPCLPTTSRQRLHRPRRARPR